MTEVGMTEVVVSFVFQQRIHDVERFVGDLIPCSALAPLTDGRPLAVDLARAAAGAPRATISASVA